MTSPSFNRFVPAAVFLVILIIGFAMTSIVYQAEESTLESRFAVIADDAVDRVRERVDQYTASLRSVQAFFRVQDGVVSRDKFAEFISGIELANRFAGMQGLGFARLIPTGEEAEVRAELARNYGVDVEVWPDETDQDRRAAIVLLEPQDNRNRAALGYDMYSEPTRRAGMMAAAAADAPVASGPVELVQEITEDKQAGFLIYLPYRAPGSTEVAGFIYAPFRAGDLHLAAFARASSLPIVVETRDETDSDPVELYRSPGFASIAAHSAFIAERSFNAAGRKWTMTVVATPDFDSHLPSLAVIALGAVSIVLAGALALTVRFQIKALDAVRGLHANAEKNLKDKDLMLQEMKHRIKNSIARVLAIARQTAAHSEGLEDFSDSYMSRLQAMAGAQDMLTRSHWQRADLAELLEVELRQVFGEEGSGWTLMGDTVELNERATQALGLVFHELATNALKYGNVTEPGGGLSVRWQLMPAKKPETLRITWTEQSAEALETSAPGSGFGTRLIDANVRGELNGSVERVLAPTGLTVKLDIAVASYA